MELNTLEDIEKAYPNEDAARKQLCEWRWGKFASCPYCGNEKAYFIEKGERFKCANPKCYKKFSVKTKSIIEASKLTCIQWVKCFYLYSKSRGRIGSYELCQQVDINMINEFYVRERIEFAWKLVPREGKLMLDIMKDLFISMCHSYERFNTIKEEPYYKNPFHVSGIDNISDIKQYNILLRYTRYYVNVFCRKWIFMDFAQPEEILTETYLSLKDNNIKEYNTEVVIKRIQHTVNKMWFKFLDDHPRWSEYNRIRSNHWKTESRRRLSNTYIVEILKSRKDYKHLSRKDLRSDLGLIESTRKIIKDWRDKNSTDTSDFQSHFS